MRTMQAVFRKKETFAPKSAHQSMEEIVAAGRGSKLEVIMGWGERVLQITGLEKKENCSIGYSAENDIVLPSLPGVPASEIGFGWRNNQLYVRCSTMLSLHIIDEDKTILEPEPLSNSWAPVPQGHYIKIQFENGFSVCVRYKAHQLDPKVLPIFDFSSKGFWSLFLSTLFSGWMSLWFSQKASGSPPKVKDLMMARLLITTPIPIPIPRKVETLKVVPKVRPKEPLKETPKVAQKPKPATPKTVSRNRKKPQGGSRAGGSPPTKPRQNNFSQKQGRKGQAAKGTEQVARSPLFATLGRSKTLDPDGGLGDRSSLSALADGATGNSGRGTGQGWKGTGSQLRDVPGKGSLRGNVGVGALNGPGRGTRGFGPQSLGGKSTVSIEAVAQSFATAGTIDKDAIRKVFFANSRAIRYCYESQLNRNSKLQGKVVLDFEIGEQGRVVGRPRIDHKNSTVVSAGLSQCLLTRLKTWAFPEPPKNQVVQVLYPLAFTQ